MLRNYRHAICGVKAVLDHQPSKALRDSDGSCGVCGADLRAQVPSGDGCYPGCCSRGRCTFPSGTGRLICWKESGKET